MKRAGNRTAERALGPGAGEVPLYKHWGESYNEHNAKVRKDIP